MPQTTFLWHRAFTFRAMVAKLMPQPLPVRKKSHFRPVFATIAALCLAMRTTASPLVLRVETGVVTNNAGASMETMASPAAALEKAEQMCHIEGLSNFTSVRIMLGRGIYHLQKPLRFGKGGFNHQKIPVSIESLPGEHPVLSGGVQVTGWARSKDRIPGLPEGAQDHVWVADAPSINGKTPVARQLWVDEKKAIRARSPNGDDLHRLLAWNKSNQTALIPLQALAGVTNPGAMEMIVDQVWENAMLRVNSIQCRNDGALVAFKQPESGIEFEHPWPPVIVKSNYQAPFFLANRIEFLDSPGEWIEDVENRKIYYWPRAGEDLTKARVTVPALETLVEIAGSEDEPVKNIHFKGITFAHACWTRPSEKGHVPLQAGMYMIKARKLSPKGTPYHAGLDNVAWIGRPPGAVSVKNASGVSFEDCRFEHLASAGLDFQSDTHGDLVEGCVFRDISGNGIQLGKFSDENVETHMPYNPADEREVCSHERIANNVVSDCGNEDWGCVGIAAGYVRSVVIEHNELFDLPYTGISVGWGWTKKANVMRDNLVHANSIHDVGRVLNDLGGIYILSAQPGTVVCENAISDIKPSRYVPDPEHWFYLYLDEGSSFVTVSNNWCPSEKFLKNANGPGNAWTNNGPQVSENIKSAAGLLPAFRSKLTDGTNRQKSSH